MRFLGCLVSVLVLAPRVGAAQAAVAGDDTVVVAAEPGDAHGAARSLQAAFERMRERHFPLTFASIGGPCDEVVGRLCTWYGEGEWVPEPEPEAVRSRRRDLLRQLDSLQAIIPSDAWVLGQRVWYRAEAGDWAEALAVAHRCGAAASWWCAALEGLALHGGQRFVEAADAFERALAEMDPGQALEWRVPDRAVDREARGILEGAVRAADGTLDVVLGRLWALADPLYLVEGNDRMTAHFARWTVATLKEGARNPYRLRWGRDLEELTVRHGWEIGWERSRGRVPGAPDDIIGHKEQEGRDYLPDGRALADPSMATAADFVAGRGQPRSLHAPVYAPVLLPMGGQVALFPRGDRVTVVATHFLPEDTTFHAQHEHARPWMEPGDQADAPDQIGLFALPLDGGPRVEARRVGRSSGALMIDVPAGAWVLSAESWSPSRRRAGRLRLGMERAPVAPDVATLSDLLLLQRTEVALHSLEAALPHALPAPEVGREGGLAVAWEVSGLGLRAETMRFEVIVERTDRSLVRRLGELFRLTTRTATVALSWEEAGPETPGPLFRHLDLATPPLAPGMYTVTLTLRTPGRSDAVSRGAFRVAPR
jgi:hypothetical protein